MKNTNFVILSGGGGERLWPLSRKNKPKQFIPFLGEKSLLEQTIERISPLVKNENKIGVITNKKQVAQVLQATSRKLDFVLDEPAARNTGPAILYSCFELAKKDKDAVVIFLPADSYVHQCEKYIAYLQKAIEYASQNEKIVTLGVMPTKPATGYGYIQACSQKINCGQVYDVFKFHEKPKKKLAEKYMHQGNMFWNIGVFVAKVSVFLNEFESCAAELFYSVQNYLNKKITYEEIEKISVDYAVMEQSRNVVILPCDFDWTDVGNLDVFLTLQNQYKKENTKVINVDGQRNLIQLSRSSKNKLVAFIGVSDLCVVEDDDVILVARRDEVEKVKQLLPKIKENKLQELL
jgi:mannose-1-phosphate guanylyltransferase